MNDFARMLQCRMAMKHLDVSDVARRMAMSKEGVRKWTIGKNIPRYETCVRLANVLNLDKEDVLREVRKVKPDIDGGKKDMYRPISKEITASEMRRMRDEEGLTQAEIAKRLEISPATVSRYIGGDGKRVVCTRVSTSSTVAESSPVIDAPAAPMDTMIDVAKRIAPERDEMKIEKPTMMTTIHTQAEVKGALCTYKLNSSVNYVEISESSGCQISGLIEFKDIPALIGELKHIYNVARWQVVAK